MNYRLKTDNELFDLALESDKDSLAYHLALRIKEYTNDMTKLVKLHTDMDTIYKLEKIKVALEDVIDNIY